MYKQSEHKDIIIKQLV